MSGTATPDGAINVAGVHAELDGINAAILDLLARGKALADDAAAALTDEARKAGTIVAPQPAVPATYATGEDGELVNRQTDPGKPPGWLGPVTDEQWAALQARLALLDKLVGLLDKPLGNAARSYADTIRAGGRRWQAR